MAENPSKFGSLPDSLREIKPGKKRPCETCGAMTPGTMYEPVSRLNLDGSLKPMPPHLCAKCDPNSAFHRGRAQYERERKMESYKGHA